MQNSDVGNDKVENPDLRDSNSSSQQVMQYYFLDHAGKLRKANDLPGDITRFVWESRESLNPEEFLYTLALSESSENYEQLVACRDDQKMHEREDIAKAFLDVSAPGVMRTGKIKEEIDMAFNNFKKLLSKSSAFDANEVILDIRKGTSIYLSYRQSRWCPILKLVWQNGKYHIYVKESESVRSPEIKLGYINSLRDAGIFRELFEKILHLNSDKNR
jgi:hypothetical protein